MIAVTFNVDHLHLQGLEDSYLLAMWHIAQANPAPDGDRDAAELVRSISAEIVRRWILETPPLLWARNVTINGVCHITTVPAQEAQP